MQNNNKQHVVSLPEHPARTLSPQRAFVVQFYGRAEGQGDCWAGRVEHISSGRATRFQSDTELWTFLTEFFDHVYDKPP